MTDKQCRKQSKAFSRSLFGKFLSEKEIVRCSFKFPIPKDGIIRFGRNMTQEPQHNSTGILDSIAVFCSALCIIHCLALPVFFRILRAINLYFVDDQAFHLILLVVVLPVSILALSLGCSRHKDGLTIIAGSAGLLLITIAAVFGHTLIDQTNEKAVTSIGSLILACAHIRNYQICRKNRCSHEVPD